MNENEKRVIVAVIVVFVAMLAYSPFHLVLANGAVLNMGYGWIFDAPKHGDITATVNVLMLVVHWLGVLVIGGLAFFMVKNSAANAGQGSSLNVATSAAHELNGVKGWLLFLCLWLTVLTPLFTLGQLSVGWMEAEPFFEQFPSLKSVVILETLCLIGLHAFGIYAGFALWSIKPGAVKIAKNFFLTMLAYFLVSPFVFSGTSDLPSEAISAIKNEGVGQAIKAILAFAVWFTYLHRSKRVRATYPIAVSHSAPESQAETIERFAAIDMIDREYQVLVRTLRTGDYLAVILGLIVGGALGLVIPIAIGWSDPVFGAFLGAVFGALIAVQLRNDSPSHDRLHELEKLRADLLR